MSDIYDTIDLVELIPALRGYANTLVKHKALAEDLVQDTLERAWRRRAEFTPATDLKPWLFAVLRNRAIDEYRKTRRSEGYALDAPLFKATEPADQHWRVLETELGRFITALPPGARDALMLVIGAGLTHKEAAEILGCPLGTLKSRIRRSQARLTELFDVKPPPCDEP